MRRDDITLLSTADWDNPFWTNKQHVAVELAKRGHRVLYIDSVGLRRPSVSTQDLRRIGSRLRKIFSPPREVRENIWVWAPAALPLQRYGLVRSFNRQILSKGLRLCRRLLRLSPDVLWTYNPMTTDLISGSEYRTLVYHCVDEIKAQPGMPSRDLERAEQELLSRANVVFTTSRALYESRGRKNPNTHYFPNVADYAHFSLALAASTNVPDDLQTIPRPRIGFVGAISGYKVDFSLVEFLARERPTWQLVLIGKVGEGDPWTDSISLNGLNNIHIMGPRPYSELPCYLKGFDVAVLPCALNEYTTSMFPMKFFEYLAAGLPVVSVNLPALEGYEELAYFAASKHDFLAGLEAALNGHAPALETRLAAARANTYAERTARMMAVVETSTKRAQSTESAGAQ